MVLLDGHNEVVNNHKLVVNEKYIGHEILSGIF